MAMGVKIEVPITNIYVPICNEWRFHDSILYDSDPTFFFVGTHSSYFPLFCHSNVVRNDSICDMEYNVGRIGAANGTGVISR